MEQQSAFHDVGQIDLVYNENMPGRIADIILPVLLGRVNVGQVEYGVNFSFFTLSEIADPQVTYLHPWAFYLALKDGGRGWQDNS